MLKKIGIVIALMFFSQFALIGQGALPSNTFVKTNYHNHDCFAHENATHIFFNELTQEVTISVDFSKCKVGHDTIDEWLTDIEANKMIFRGTINSSELLSLTNSNSKSYKINGKIKFNDVVLDKTVEVIFFEISKEGMLYRNNGNDYYDRVRANFQIEISPKDFKIDKKAHKLNKNISVSVGSGYVNPYKPGMETFIE